MSDCPLCRSSSWETLERFHVSQLLRIAPKQYRSLLREELRAVDEFHVRQCHKCHIIYFSPSVPGSDRFYQRLAQESFYYMKDKPEYSLIKPYLPEPLRLLEVGCGPGHFADQLGGNLVQYQGLDINPSAVQQAQSRGLSVSQDRIESYAQLHPKAFTAVGSFQVLEHIADVCSFITSSLACLEDKGVFFFSIPNQDSFVGRSPNQMLNLPPHHMTRWPRATLEALGDIFPLEPVALIEEELADHHLYFYIQNCYRIGQQKRSGQSNWFVSPIHPRIEWVRKVFERFVLSPILIDVMAGMTDFKPRAKGHTILAVYRKQSAP